MRPGLLHLARFVLEDQQVRARNEAEVAVLLEKDRLLSNEGVWSLDTANINTQIVICRVLEEIQRHVALNYFFTVLLRKLVESRNSSIDLDFSLHDEIDVLALFIL